MGHDSLHPVTNTCDDDFGGWGATAVDALTSAIMFENEAVVLQILRFIATLDFTVVAGGTSIQLFEVTIRHFGSMISAYDLLHGPYSHIGKDDDLRAALRAQMIKLGGALSCGFSTPSGIPRNWVDPTLCTTDSGKTNTIAGTGSLILEFARLSDITEHRMYVELARKAEQYLIHPQSEDRLPFPGLFGSFISVYDGSLQDTKGSWGSLADCKRPDPGHGVARTDRLQHSTSILSKLICTIRSRMRRTSNAGNWLQTPRFGILRRIHTVIRSGHSYLTGKGKGSSMPWIHCHGSPAGTSSSAA